MKIAVLGSAAGGRVPQWNCACANCREAREGSGHVAPRTQDSVAVSADGEAWVLCNASPDIGTQLERCAALWPRRVRDTPITAIVLTNGDIDHCAGLLSLRESQPLTIYATETVWSAFVQQNVLARTLQRFPEQLTWHPLRLGERVQIRGARGLAVTPRAIAGKRPVHLELGGRGERSPEDNVALFMSCDRGRSLAYVPAAGSIEEITSFLHGPHADTGCLLFDGTFWSEDELPRNGIGSAMARDMAHVPIGGERGSLRGLAGVRVARRIYTHLNNTNPVLGEDSEERRIVTEAGWEVAHDGMEVTL